MTRRQRTHHHHAAVTVYTHWHELLASPTEPMPKAFRTAQLTRMWSGLASIETSPKPTANDWRVVSDAVNLLETLIEMGVAEDSTGLLHDATRALAIAGARHLETGVPIRLDGAGMQAVRAVLESYAEILDQIPHRTAIAAHRRTEKRIQEIYEGKRRPHDVEIMAL